MEYEELTIEGRNPVLEAFRSGKAIDRLFVLDRCKDGPILSIIREAKKTQQKADLALVQPSFKQTDYVEMRKVTRTETDIPEGVRGYDISEMVRKAGSPAADAVIEAVGVGRDLPDQRLVSGL